MTSLSDQVRQAIRTSGLTPYRIAKETGVSEPTLSRFLNGGTIRLALVDRIAELLGMRIVTKAPAATKELVRREREKKGG